MTMNVRTNYGRRFAWGIAGLLCSATFVHTSTPIHISASTIPYQGLATDANGKPVADGNSPVVFALYDAATGGNTLWTETQSVATAKGLFSTSLGIVKALPDSLFHGSALYLGVAFNGGTEGTRSLLSSPTWAKASDSSRASRLADSSRTSHFSDSAGVVAGLKDSVAALRMKAFADSTAHALQRTADTAAWQKLHRVDSALIASQATSIALQRQLILQLMNPTLNFGIPWNPTIAYDSLTDSRDSQVYRTVRIGTQIWMAQNLNYARADSVGLCYQFSPDSCSKYGRVYGMATAMDLSIADYNAWQWIGSDVAHRGICPVGWHIPNNAEWSTLLAGIGSGQGGLSAGFRLKAMAGWNPNGSVSGNGSDEFGFRALPGGSMSDFGSLQNGAGTTGSWWSATKNNFLNAFQMDNAHETVLRLLTVPYQTFNAPTDTFRSVRCVQD